MTDRLNSPRRRTMTFRTPMSVPLTSLTSLVPQGDCSLEMQMVRSRWHRRWGR